MALRVVIVAALCALFAAPRSGIGRAQTATTLLPGWNNILYLGPSGPIIETLAPIADRLTMVMRWDAAGQRWLVYFPPAPQASDFDTLQQGEVYWIAVQSDATLAASGDSPPPRALVPGWNNAVYLGAGAPTSATLERGALWSWDAAQQRWLFHDPSAPNVSDFQVLTPLQPYWLFVSAQNAAAPGLSSSVSMQAPPTPVPAPQAESCFPFRSLQPSLAEAYDAVSRAGLGSLNEGPDLAPLALRSGADGAGPLQAFYSPPTIMRAIAWVETGWHQATLGTTRGHDGPTLTSVTCAYGLMQILTGMHIEGKPTLRQFEIGSDFRANAAAGAQLLGTYWNREPDSLPYLGRHDPHILEDWYFTVWAYHCFGDICPRYGAHNNPDDPVLTWPRPAYNSPDQLASSTGLGYTDYPYQELVYGLVQYPPLLDQGRVWPAIPVALPPHGSVGYPVPHAVSEPSAHLDDGASLPVYAVPPATPAAPASPTPGPTAAPGVVLVPPPVPPR